jgi:hypothetical protein
LTFFNRSHFFLTFSKTQTQSKSKQNKMMRFTSMLLLALSVLAASIPRAEGLAFVASVARTNVNPIAAFKSLGRARAAADTSSTILGAGPSQADAPKSDRSYISEFGRDESTARVQDEMRDLVYQRSLERMNGFSS